VSGLITSVRITLKFVTRRGIPELDETIFFPNSSLDSFVSYGEDPWATNRSGLCWGKRGKSLRVFARFLVNYRDSGANFLLGGKGTDAQTLYGAFDKRTPWTNIVFRISGLPTAEADRSKKEKQLFEWIFSFRNPGNRYEVEINRERLEKKAIKLLIDGNLVSPTTLKKRFPTWFDADRTSPAVPIDLTTGGGLQTVEATQPTKEPVLERTVGSSQSVASFGTIADNLKRLKVPRDEVFEKAGYFESNPDRKCIGPIVSIHSPRGTVGIGPEMIEFRESKRVISHPPYLKKAISAVTVTGRNGNKAMLTDWHQFPLDVDDGKLTLDVSRAKYSWKIAMRDVRPKLLNELTNAKIRILKDGSINDDQTAPILPCHLHCDALVLTGDDHIILAQRGTSVDLDKLQWAASFGEGIEWDSDRSTAHILHPLNTIWRGLNEELGLQEGWLQTRFGETAKITFMDLCFQVDSLIYLLFSIIEIPSLGVDEALDRARNHRTDTETRLFSSMKFCAENCVSAVVHGVTDGRTINYAGRYGILLAAITKLGSEFSRALSSFE